jgi:hypothetical protein
MSPPGIPMFYGANDPVTALHETWQGAGRYVTGCFELTRSILILDLTDVPPVPSLFEPVSDTAERNPRYELMFLHDFVRQVSAPIDRQELAHIDYVPTQVVAEFFRTFPLPDGRRLDGIRYTSAQRPEFACYALFAEQSDVIPSPEDESAHNAQRGPRLPLPRDGWLRLVRVTEEDVANLDSGPS